MNTSIAPPQRTSPERTSAVWTSRAKAAGRLHAYALVALPVSLAGLIAVPLGGGRRVGRLNRSLARRLLGTPTDAEQATGRRRRLLWHWLTALPADLLAFAIVAPVWGVFLTRGVLYPLFGADNLEQSWGGPTLAGAWFVHFIQGPPLLLVVTLVLWPVSRLQAARAHKAP